MKQFISYLSALCLLTGSCLLTSCSNKDTLDFHYYADTQRLIIKGEVTNADSQALSGIRVDIEGVGDETETNAINYNYAITDDAGQYIICRYLGREMPQQVTVIVSDPQNTYQGQSQTISRENYIHTNNSVIEINADFVLLKNP